MRSSGRERYRMDARPLFTTSIGRNSQGAFRVFFLANAGLILTT